MPNIWVQHSVDIIFGLGLFINAVLFIPQVLKIYKDKSAQHLSVITFAGFNFIQFFTVLHAYLHHDYILFFGTLLSLLTCGWVTVLIFYYNRKKA